MRWRTVCVSVKRDLLYGKRDLLYGKRDLLIRAYLRREARTVNNVRDAVGLQLLLVLFEKRKKKKKDTVNNVRDAVGLQSFHAV